MSNLCNTSSAFLIYFNTAAIKTGGGVVSLFTARYNAKISGHLFVPAG